MKLLDLSAAAMLAMTAACASDTPPQRELVIASAQDGVTASLDGGEYCKAPCSFKVDGSLIHTVTFSKPGCLTTTQMSGPQIVNRWASREDLRNYVLGPNPLKPELICS